MVFNKHILRLFVRVDRGILREFIKKNSPFSPMSNWQKQRQIVKSRFSYRKLFEAYEYIGKRLQNDD